MGDAPNEPKMVSRDGDIERGDVLVHHGSSSGDQEQKRNVHTFHVQNLLAHIESGLTCYRVVQDVELNVEVDA